MSLLFIDGALERLVCNTCQKFLSVQPIKVYPNRKIKCGRCSEDGDAGVVSLFNLLAAQCIFKCVNRFDGCRKLLTYTEVSEHELECVGKSYVCPICSVSTTVPTFLMISHFKKEHKEMYLDSPSFFIDVNKTFQITNFFLYKHHDLLFFVIFRYDVPIEYITMGVMLLGDLEDARNINHQFKLFTGIELIYFREKLCVGFDLSNIGELDIEKIKIPKHLGVLNVTFRMSMVNVAGMVNLPVRYHSSDTEQITDGTDEKCFNLRYIYLDDDFRKTYSNFSIGLNFISLMKDENIEIILSCSNCSLMDYCWFKDHSSSVYTHKIEEKIYFVCFMCYKYIKNIAISPSNMLNVDTLNKISFFCLWKCGKFFNMTLLNNHEINCSLQPVQKCPVIDCEYRNKLFDIKEHMINAHSQEFTVFYDKQQRELRIPLLIETSQIKQFVLVDYKFILIKLFWVEPQWNISIHKCTPCQKCDAVAIIFDDRYNLLSHLKQNQTVKICHMENLRIKCYFEMKGSESISE